MCTASVALFPVRGTLVSHRQWLHFTNKKRFTDHLCFGLSSEQGQDLVVLLFSLYQISLSEYNLVGLNK